jgi:ADP-ribose pyrophosphatase YjhB (NUDIX family)
MQNLPVRFVARVVLLDQAKNILLVKYEDTLPMDPEREGPFTYWVPPGGELEAGEDYASAAKRELMEESGLSIEIGPWIWEREQMLRVRDQLVLQKERFFLAKIGNSEPPVANQSSEDILEVRWWSVNDLLDSDSVFFPDGFISLVAPIITGEIPSEPIQI